MYLKSANHQSCHQNLMSILLVKVPFL